MKKVIIISLAALLFMAACTKTDKGSISSAISFQTAAYATRAGIDGSVFPTTEVFGVYAWASGSPDSYFMNNEKVAYDGEGKWVSEHEFYWIYKQTIDFIGYYPYNMPEVNIGKEEIKYTAMDVESRQIDAMYSSRATGYAYNPDGTYAGVDGSAGVPILFHHALGKVVIDARTAYDHVVETDGTVYDWEVTVNSITVSDFYKKGDATFTIENEPSEGIVGWTKPADADGFNVWTNDGAKTSISNQPKVLLNSETPVNVLPEFFVLPQVVVKPEVDQEGRIIPGQPIHKVTVNLTVKTILNGEKLISETYNRSAYMYLEEIPAWQINYRNRYLLIIYPLGPGTGPGPDSHMPVITFDPAVADWDYITVYTTLYL